MLRKVRGDAETQLLLARKGWSSGPVLRPPVYTVSTRLMIAAQVVKALARVVWFALRHPLPTLTLAAGLFLYVRYGWAVDVLALAVVAAVLGAWAFGHRPSFLRVVGLPGPVALARRVPPSLATRDDHHRAVPVLP